MKSKNIKAAEWILIIAIILFIVFTVVTYRNLGLLQEGMSNSDTETTTVMGE
ncbi:MAG: hypothetical protein Q4D26_03345 [Clostridia bacterium]|nr:hypothetical protein [Clostridia bacterium]